MERKFKWKRLRHAFGSAEDIPPLLDKLQANNQEGQKEAIDGLGERLCHQGTSYVVSVYCLSTLFSLLNSENCRVKSHLLELITCICLGIPCEYLLYGFLKDRKVTIEGLEILNQGPYFVEEACFSNDILQCRAGAYAYLCQHQDEIGGFLDSNDERLRIRSLYTLAWLPDLGNLKLSLEKFLSNPNLSTKESANGIVAYWLNGLHSKAQLRKELFSRFFASNDRIVSICASLALFEQFRDPMALDVVEGATHDDTLYLGYEYFPFCDGNLEWFAQVVLEQASDPFAAEPI